MNFDDISEKDLFNNIIDLNSNKIPAHVLDSFYSLKHQIGSLPMGISFIPNKGYFFIDTSAKVYKYFSVTPDQPL